MSRGRWTLMVVWLDGSTEFLKQGPQGGEEHAGQRAYFSSRKRAESHRDFMLIGMAEDVQSINVVRD